MILLGISLERAFTEAERKRLASCLPKWHRGGGLPEDAVLAAHGLLRMALTQAGVWGATELVCEPGGKPRLAGESGLCVSLSHTESAALCAVSHREVGVDVQRFREINVPHIRRALGVTAGEQEDLLWLWARRESAAKLSGAGVAGLKAPLLQGVFVYPYAEFEKCSAAVASFEARRPELKLLSQPYLCAAL